MNSDIELMSKPTYKEMSEYFNEYFGIWHLNVPPDKKFMLLTLIGYVVVKAKEKQPDVTYYKIVQSVSKNLGLREHDIYGLAIMSEAFTKGCDSSQIPTFGLKGNEIINAIKSILMQWLPF